MSFRAHNPGAPEDKAKSIFADIDVGMSNGISRRELIPASGDDMAHVDQSMVNFKIPLAHIAELVPESEIAPRSQLCKAFQDFVKFGC